MGRAGFKRCLPSPLRGECLLPWIPATLWLANLRLSLRDEGTPRREQLELLQPAEKFGGEEGHVLGRGWRMEDGRLWHHVRDLLFAVKPFKALVRKLKVSSREASLASILGVQPRLVLVRGSAPRSISSLQARVKPLFAQ